uniref:Uncharacterized protein n=1 Tax=Rhizophora mucronata TaxID=61149 RepID=A0A2P2JAH9_RHIMU
MLILPHLRVVITDDMPCTGTTKVLFFL